MNRLHDQLVNRRLDLGISFAALAQKTGLGMATVKRAFSKPQSATMATMDRIAEALALELSLKPKRSLNGLLLEQARRRARCDLSDHTMGRLERQEEVERRACRYLRGSKSKLWREP